MKTLYDDIGIEYSVGRCTDPEIAQQLYSELEGATRIVNIGAGTGSYEPAKFDLIALEPSAEMISQRTTGAHPVVQAGAEKIPFEQDSFSHAMTVLSMHHWRNRVVAFSEINRVTTEKFVAITWDPKAEPFWLTKEYFPQIYQNDLTIFPGLEEMSLHFDDVKMSPLLIPANCQDGFLAAFWKRPYAYLESRVRQSMSPFSRIGDLTDGLRKLESDLASGKWKSNNHALLNAESLDVGYRLVTATIRK